MDEIKYFAQELEQFIRKGEQLLERLHQGGMMGQNGGYGMGGYRRGSYGNNNGSGGSYGNNSGNGGGYGNNNGSWPIDPRFM